MRAPGMAQVPSANVSLPDTVLVVAVTERREEFESGSLVVAEQAPIRGRHHFGAGLANAAHRHAQVLGDADHGHPAGLQLFHQYVGDLAGEPLLQLQPSSIDIDNPRELADADHSTVRDVPDVERAVKRKQMVL